MKTIFLKAAQLEFDKAVDYYAEHASTKLAEAFIDAVQAARQRLT